MSETDLNLKHKFSSIVRILLTLYFERSLLINRLFIELKSFKIRETFAKYYPTDVSQYEFGKMYDFFFTSRIIHR